MHTCLNSKVLSLPKFLFLLIVSYFTIINPSSSSEASIVKCTKTERDALVTFKKGLKDPSGILSSWLGDECCNWKGIRCDNKTGHVVMLNLRNPTITNPSDLVEGGTDRYLSGQLSPSLLSLKQLNYLDLSLNFFQGSTIPQFLGSFTNLRYLNLSFTLFSGKIPPHLGNLSLLHQLDLSQSLALQIFGEELHVENLHWISGLPLLKHLNLGSVNLSGVREDWLQTITLLPSLQELRLRSCELSSLPSKISFPNISTSLLVLDVGKNSFNSTLPNWLFNLTSLERINLEANNFYGGIPREFINLISLQEFIIWGNYLAGPIPESLGGLCKLRVLDLSYNSLNGSIDDLLEGFKACPYNSLQSLNLSNNQLVGHLPDSIGRLEFLKYLNLETNGLLGSIPASTGNLSHLQVFDLSFNQMNGTIPESIGQLAQLVSLFLHFNPWRAVLTETHFSNLTSLQHLDTLMQTSQNNLSFLVFKIRETWIPPFNLQDLSLENCNLGPQFPSWLQTQSELEYIRLDNVGIDDAVPSGFWNCCSKLSYLTMSNNELKGEVQSLLGFSDASFIDLSFNSLEGPFPLLPTNLSQLRLAENFFSGQLPNNIGELENLRYLDLSSNLISGRIPPSIGNLSNLKVFSLRNNLFSGKLPDHWQNLESLRILDVAGNNISGIIPTTLGSLGSLFVLSFSNNYLTGEIPSSLANCTNLGRLDAGGNNFDGNLPAWIGNGLSSLFILSLRSNNYTGQIPQQFCLLSELQVLDLANNSLSGRIPQCLGNLSKTTRENDMYSTFEYMMLVSKGRELFYRRTLYLVHSIDLSNNNLSGEIPDNITNLFPLRILNLSLNHLTGKIPADIGNLSLLETLDLSENQLSGQIPQSLSSLTFLSHLNLSFNSLSGKIPTGNQLQTLKNSSIYEGNPLLCGSPLETRCPGDDEYDQEPTPNGGNQDDNIMEDGNEMMGFYISMATGFVVGFWGVCITLIVKRSWRYAYFRLFDKVKDELIVFVVVTFNGWRRKLKWKRDSGC